MKTYRVLVGVLSLAVVVLAYLLLSGRGKPAAEKPQEMWHTNTVELWHTNTIEQWRTNTLEVARTNTVTQAVTNEVIKEVPAKLSDLEKRAGTVGFKLINAPLLTDPIDALYRANPLAVDVSIDKSAKHLLTATNDIIKKKIEDILRSRKIAVADKSPYHFCLNVAAMWETDVPRVVLLAYRLELNETAALQRQNEIVKRSGSLWSASASQLARKFKVADEVSDSLRDQLGKFCKDYLKAKDNEKDIESRIPAVPPNFLSK